MKKLLSTVLVTVMVFALAAGTFVHAAASVAAESLDNIFVNGAQLFNGGAETWLAANEVKGKIQTIGIRGWIILGNNEMPSSFGYKIDDGDPVKVADSVVYDQAILDATGNAYPNMRRDVFAADVSGVGLGEHTFTIAAWNEAGEVAYGKSFTFTQELAPGEIPPPPAPTIVANNLDAWGYWYADSSLGATPAVYTHGEITGFHIAGWFGYNYEAIAIGYRINGVETYVDGAFRTPEPAVKDLAGQYALRYDMDGSFNTMVLGANDFDIIVKLNDDDQTVVELFSNIPAQIMPTAEEAVYFYDPSSYTTGYWTGPNAGFPDGSDIQIALTAPASFDGVFMFAYASPAPTAAVMNINLYDKDNTLLETVTQTFNGDAYAATKFSKVYPAGDYTLQYVFADGAHFVLGSGTPVGQTYTIGGVCNNEHPESAPSIALIKAELPVRDPSVSTGNAALDEFKYDGVDVGSGSLYKWINNPDNREEIDFEKGAVSEIYFRGWAQLNNPVAGFGYVLDGGEVVTDPSFVQDRAAELANASFDNAQGYTVTVPVADLAAGEHTVKIVAIDDEGAAVEIIKTKEEVDYPIALTFTVSEAAAPVNPAELIKANLDIFTLSNCNLSVAGWAGANLPANNLGYKVDDGEVVFDGIVFANFNTPAEGDTIKSLAGENAFRFKTESDIALDLEPGEHTITLVMRVSDGNENYIVEMKSKTFTVSAEPDPAILKNMSFNTVWVDGVQVCDIGDAFEYLNANPIVDASAVGFRGWAQIGNSTIVAFGYKIDDGEPVCDAAYTQDRPDVRGAVGGTPETTNGFVVSPIDVSGLAAGDHTIAVVVKAADDTYVTIVTIPVTVSSSETPSVSTGNAALDEFKYDGVDVGSGSLYKWINNPDNREEIDFEKGAVSEIYFRGWAQLTNPVVGFGYVLDGGEVVTDPSFVQDRAAELANASFENAQGYTVTVPVADLAAGEHTVKIVAIDEAGNAVEIIKTKEEVDYPIALTFTVKGEEPANHEIAGKSFDWYARNGAFISTTGKVDQFVDEGTGIVYLHCGGDVVGFMGWAALKDEAIDHFAYAIDGGELVTDENGMLYDRAAELAAAGINGKGFWIVFDYTALEDGLHSVAFYAVAADGTPVEIFSYNFSVYDVDDFTWLYGLSTYSTGFWTGPNCGRPTGDIAVTFETPTAFNGVFTAFFADNVPGALMRVDLYDENEELLESVEQKFVHNDNGIVIFKNAYEPGIYTVDYVYIGETGHFVLGSGPATEIEAVVSGDNGTNDDTLAAPSIALLNAEVPAITPATLIKNNFDIFDLSNGVLTVQGWAGANYPANNLGYKIDDGEVVLDGVEFANFNTPAEGDTIKSLAGENAFRYKTRGTGIALDLTNGEHTITIVMRVNDGTENHIVEMGSKKFTVTGEKDPAVLKNFSFNTVWADGTELCDTGDALAFLKSNPIPSGTETIGLRGWAWIGNSEIDAFGYKIDDGEPVCDAAFTQDRADVQAAVGQTAAYANGFNIQGIDVSDLDAGDHIITVVVKATDGTFVKVVDVPYTVVSDREDSKSTGNAALDEFMYDGVDIAEGSKYIWINNPENKEAIDFVKGQVKEIYFRGWAQLNNPISGFGYSIDGGDIITSPTFVQDRTAELATAGYANAQGFTVVVPVEDLEPGEHTIKIVAIDDMGVAVEIIKTKNEVDYPIALTFTVGEETPKFALGDINMDGEVNNKDVVVLFRYVSEIKHETELPLEVADMNNDGAIDNKDVVLLFKQCSNI